MFGSTSPFGQSSTSPFGQTSFGAQQQGFGQAASNPFAPKPFGSPTTTFGAQTGSSLFGNTSTGAFGQQQSTPTFGTPSSSPFGSSTPAFGASPTPAFGATSSTFGSGSVFGQKPSFGAFGSSPSQSSPFGSTFQQTQPAFGSNAFGATTTPTTPAFGATTTPAFGATTAPAFGATTAPAFGATTTPAFGTSTTPAFGSTSTPLFGATSTPAFGSTTFGSSTPATGFGTSGTTAFGASNSPGFGSTPTFGFGSSASAGQTTAFGTSPFGGNTSPFGAQASTFGSQPAATPFGQAPFGNQTGGSRIKPYAQTPDADSATGGSPAAKLDSISAMPEYKDKSHEELRWEDYQRGDKGGPSSSGTPAVVPQPNPQPNPFSAPINQVNPNPFSSTPQNNPFAPKTSTGFGSNSTFGTSFNNASAASSNLFTSSPNTTLFGQSGGSLFPTTSSSLFSSTNPTFASSSLFGTSSSNPSPFNTGSQFTTTSTQSAGLFQTSPAFLQQSSSTPAFSSSGSMFSTPSLFASGSSPFSTPTFQQSTPAQTSNMFFHPTIQPALGGFTGFSNTTPSQAPIGQLTPIQSNMVMQPAPISHPYGTLPAMPQMSIGNAGSSPSVQYGISSLPVAEKPLPSRTPLSMVVPRHLSQRRIKLNPRKYNPISDGKVPFFADDEESSATPKADAFFIPRENPRNLIIRPIDQWPSRSAIDRRSIPNDSADLEKYKGASIKSERGKAAMSPSRSSPVENGSSERADVSRHGNSASVDSLMPKLPDADYFTEPSLEELAAKERAEPGYCSHVRDFVVGRHNYGSIKFLGETDVRGLDLESILEFNYREVIVYKDDSKKPPVGKGLNKAAEVTLLNIKCMNKKTNEEYLDGPRVDRYREMLVKKAEEQGAEFVSFDAAKGEWKFRVKHFSAYGFW